jgi:hypothetical protein
MSRFNYDQTLLGFKSQTLSRLIRGQLTRATVRWIYQQNMKELLADSNDMIVSLLIMYKTDVIDLRSVSQVLQVVGDPNLKPRLDVSAVYQLLECEASDFYRGIRLLRQMKKVMPVYGETFAAEFLIITSLRKPTK